MNIVESNTIQKTILVYLEVDTLYESQKLEKGFDEFKSLAISSGLLIKNSLKFSQKSPVINTFISKGKLEKLKNLVLESDVDLIIINHQLSASQTRNLEKYLDKRVIDKTELILDIFALHAQSKEATLQVELALTTYLKPRLAGLGKTLNQQGGGIGTRGPGEAKLETDSRLIDNRINKLRRELKKIENLLKRDRSQPKFSSRTIDIDIILVVVDDDIQFVSDELEKYNFVGIPINEIISPHISDKLSINQDDSNLEKVTTD